MNVTMHMHVHSSQLLLIEQRRLARFNLKFSDYCQFINKFLIMVHHNMAAVNPMSDGGGGLIAPSPDNMGSCAIGIDFFDDFFL